MEPVDGAPCFFSGSLTLGGCGLPSTDRLADCFVAGNGKMQGGWSAFHTFASSATASSPATHPLITGRGAKGWFGWWDNADARALTTQQLSAPDDAGQEKAAKGLSMWR